MRYCTVHTSDGRTLQILPRKGETIAQTIWTDGRLEALPLCSGLGRCGRCRVRFLATTPESLVPPATDSERTVLGQNETDEGWRLACRHLAQPGMELSVPAPEQSRHRHDSPTLPGPYRLAVDLGTTSLQWVALTPDGREALADSELNPQMGAGSEVMSRIGFARTDEGRGILCKLVTDSIKRICTRLGGKVSEICIAGNTAMTTIFANRDVSGLASAPYHLTFTGGETIDIPGLAPIWIPPQPAPFVGGDVSAGYLAILEEIRPRFPFLLADLGTNGEFVLALSSGKALVASVALGPALEGIGLTFGTVAREGAITAFTLGPQGPVAHALPGAPLSGISGTGYLSLISLLLRVGLLDADGSFIQSPASPLAARIAATLYEAGGEVRLPLTGGFYLSGVDIEEILKVKAAFSLAFERLLAAADIPSTALSGIHLAGALGLHASPLDLEGLGFLPPGTEARTRAVGNTSLRGATLLLTKPALRETLCRWREGCEVVDLAKAPDFTAAFLRHMHFHF